MTTRRTDEEQARANALKVVRAAIRLKHSIAADEEINQVLPAFEKRFNAALNRGEVPEPLDVKRALGL